MGPTASPLRTMCGPCDRPLLLMHLTLLLLLPPLGWLQLTHRHDMAVAPRIAIAALSALLVVAAWSTALRLQPWA